MSNDKKGIKKKIYETGLVWECIAQDAIGGCRTDNTLPNLD